MTSLRKRLLLSAICSLLMLTACTAYMAPPADLAPLDQDQAAGVLGGFNVTRLLGRAERLTAPDLQGRAAGTQGEDLAGDFLIAELKQIGLAPWQGAELDGYHQRFPVKGKRKSAENILAELPGQSRDSLLVIAAHYDHLGIRGGTYYPGADDNAVGVATLLEIAQCFAAGQVKPERTVLFALLSAEENGLKGSLALAKYLRSAGLSAKTIVLNLDMLGGTGGNSLDVWLERSRPDGRALATVAEREIKATGIGTARTRRRFASVDSASFARRGMPSITLSWDLTKANHPYRHSPNDTFANLRSDLVEQGSRAAVRVALAMANWAQQR